MADANTTRYSFVKPEVGASSDTWGAKWNTNNDDYDALLGAITTTGSANAYVLTTGLSLAAYVSGQSFIIKPNFTNNGAATLNVDGLGAKNIYRNVAGTPGAVSSGDVQSGIPIRVTYDGTQFVVHGPVASTFQAADATLTALAAITWTSGTLHLTLTAADTITLLASTALVHTTGAETIAGAKLLTSALTVNLNAASLQAILTGAVIHAGNADGSSCLLQLDAYNGTPGFQTRHSRGTAASPSATQSGDFIGVMSARGFGATAYASGARGGFQVLASENWTDSAQGTRGSLQATPVGSTTQAEFYRWGDPSSNAELGWRGTPQNTSLGPSDYTLVAADAGKQIYHSDAGTDTLTIPANSSVPFPIGTIIRVINGASAGVVTIAITTDTLQRLDGTAGTGSRTVAASSAVALEKLTSTTWGISGVFT